MSISGAKPPGGQTPPSLPALDEATTAAISAFFDAKLQAALAAQTNSAPQPGQASEGAPLQQPPLPFSLYGGNVPTPALSGPEGQPSGAAAAAALSTAASDTATVNPDQEGERSYSEEQYAVEVNYGP